MFGMVFLAIGVVLLFLAAHPFASYAASLRLLSRFRPRPLTLSAPLDVSRARVAFCLCAYNEEAVIRSKIENMLAMRDTIPDLEVLVYVDGSTDKTAEIVAGFGNDIKPIISTTRHGKTYGNNLLVASTAADLIVYTDANVEFAPDALVNLLRPFADPQVGCALGHLEYVTRVKSVTAATGSGYWRREEALKELETRTGSAITADGAIYAIRRELHVPPPLTVSDDIFISMAIMCAGYRVVRVADAVAYEDVVSDPRQEFSRKVRIACLAYNAHRLLWPQLRKMPVIELYKYVSHKLLRWLTIYLQLAAGLCFLVGVVAIEGWQAALALAVLGMLALGTVYAFPRGLLGKIRSVLQAFVATGIGVWYSYRGGHFQVWVPPTRLTAPTPLTASWQRR